MNASFFPDKHRKKYIDGVEEILNSYRRGNKTKRCQSNINKLKQKNNRVLIPPQPVENFTPTLMFSTQF